MVAVRKQHWRVVAVAITLLLSACTDQVAERPALRPDVPQSHYAVAAISDCEGCPELVVIPPGKYRLGHPPDPYIDSSKFVFQDRLDVQYFELTAPFAIGRYEVTVGQYRDCVAAGGCSFISSKLDGLSDNSPAIFVHWHDARQYVAWLAEKTGQPYRLPTETEWEIAARGGTEDLFWWGDELDPGYANVSLPGSVVQAGQAGPARLQPVGSYPPNPYGLYDVIGNVVEWTSDCALLTDPDNPDSECLSRVVRSSAYLQTIARFHPAYRRGAGRVDYVNTEGTAAYTRNQSIGFRVARDLP
jgi:formylglycine-generating enzyme required for sulfatase activity